MKMEKARKKRFQRIESLDQKRLDASINELRQCYQTIEQRKQIRNSILLRLRESLTELENSASLELKNHTVEWADRMQSTLAQLDEHLESLDELRSQLLEKVRQQRVKVEGWTVLLEKIEAEEMASMQKEAMFEADDRVLGKLSANQRRTK
ncbi:kinetochore Spc7 family protein [Mariniblastus fucicola]|uniref:Flagellar FliJ protein n=1 Tax=Mariniblastus fucicola TaxID=980251 RepID=A0A5B9PAG8_9BACT|nr:hypothetical protein [Mariniblastus fucicola]QEG23368.1 hypothetical protein MFFC18_32660 [Mariniblastus fucicola]